jgi:hypothetical protein
MRVVLLLLGAVLAGCVAVPGSFPPGTSMAEIESAMGSAGRATRSTSY